ncbi:MAG TPA: pitrilysin family protein [Thermoanaerobaculia bacterium]|nr:pitrilysin family protein [Thermoanaerobaculia bacterium]
MTAVRSKLIGASLLMAMTTLPLAAQDVASFEQRTVVRKLDNGLTLIVMERPEAPVFSYATVVNAGSAQEVTGITGLAHMFEHMAFKVTDKIGTTDSAAESAALAKVEEAYAAYDAERRKPVGRDDARVAQLEKAWKDAIDAAQKYVVPNQFSRIVDEAGGVDMNAFTAEDETAYFYSLPSNRFELWAYLESERFLHPVFREFYKERDVVTEERRLSYESNPLGRLFLEFIPAAYSAHPYGVPGIGWTSDLQTISATDAAAFFRKYYVPSNIVVTVVGDVKAAAALPVLERYFGRLPKAPAPEPLRTVEPPQRSERTIVIQETSQPIYLEGYHRPAISDPDNAVYDVISDLMAKGRTSRLYRSLVRDQKIASQAGGFNGFPGDKYPNLFMFFGFTTPGHTGREIGDAIHKEIDRLRTEDVSADELASVKTRAKADLLRQLDSNSGLALQMAIAQTVLGDWRELFRSVDRIDKVTAADVRRIANVAFVPTNRTVGLIESTSQKPAAKGESK